MLAMMHPVTGSFWFMAVNLAGTTAFALAGVLRGKRDGYSLFVALVLALRADDNNTALIALAVRLIEETGPRHSACARLCVMWE